MGGAPCGGSGKASAASRDDSASGGAPLRVGLISDIQYADCEDGQDFSGIEKRHYRNALSIAKAAVKHWNEAGVEVLVQLGDVIDGCNKNLGASQTALAAVTEALGQCSARTRLDLIGNHELYNISRQALPTSGLRCCGAGGRTYRCEPLNDHWEAVCLDPYEHALIGFASQSDAGFAKAVEVMQAANPQVLRGGGGDWFTGQPEDMHRFVPYNGGVSSQQLSWLDDALSDAALAGRKALVFSHVPLYRPATKFKTLVWNAEEILRVLHAHQDTVVAVFAGHDHDGGYAVDDAGLHHVTMNSPLTAAVGSDCCAVLECHDDGWARFVAFGRACVESETLGAGRAYTELVLAKGATNSPAGPSLYDADGSGFRRLVALGFSGTQAREAMRATGGDVALAEERLRRAAGPG